MTAWMVVPNDCVAVTRERFHMPSTYRNRYRRGQWRYLSSADGLRKVTGLESIPGRLCCAGSCVRMLRGYAPPATFGPDRPTSERPGRHGPAGAPAPARAWIEGWASTATPVASRISRTASTGFTAALAT